jgi:hypothetical protein
MTSLWSILAVALLSVVFVLTHRNRGCPGAHACDDAGGADACPGCPHRRAS